MCVCSNRVSNKASRSLISKTWCMIQMIHETYCLPVGGLVVCCLPLHTNFGIIFFSWVATNHHPQVDLHPPRSHIHLGPQRYAESEWR